jgi:RimJ/RimL family protein N-acetyltransferase
MKEFQLVSFSEEFLDLSWTWLNDPLVAKLTNTPIFSKEDQKKWFHSLHENENYRIWGVIFNDQKIGACGLKNITQNDCEYWGYIGEKSFWNKGIGTMILNNIISIAKKDNLESIWLNVLYLNKNAIHLYEKLGFKIEGPKKTKIIKMRLYV